MTSADFVRDAHKATAAAVDDAERAPVTAEDFVNAAKWANDVKFLEVPADDPDVEQTPLLKKHRAHHINVAGFGASMAPAILNMLIPPILFTGIFSILCFKVHYTYPRAVWAVCIAGFVPMIYTYTAMKRAQQKPDAHTRWYKVTLVQLVLAQVLALGAGELIFWFFFHVYYRVTAMKTYTNISPPEVTGQRLMDAGVVHFAEGTRIETDMGMSFTNWDVYCVAPITIPGTEMASYDLWAVGVNCCRSEDPVFACGEYNNHLARGGLRQVSEDHRLFYRLAVQQAEAAYNINANHPIFFYWTQDPNHDIDEFFITGFKHWLMLCMLHFFINAAIILVFFSAFRPSRAPATLHTVGL